MATLTGDVRMTVAIWHACRPSIRRSGQRDESFVCRSSIEKAVEVEAVALSAHPYPCGISGTAVSIQPSLPAGVLRRAAIKRVEGADKIWDLHRRRSVSDRLRRKVCFEHAGGVAIGAALVTENQPPAMPMRPSAISCPSADWSAT